MTKVSGGNKMSKELRHDKRKNGRISRAGIEELGNRQDNEDGDRVADKRKVESAMREKKLQKSRRKKRENGESIKEGGSEEFGTQQNNEDGDRVSVKRNVLSGPREKKLQKSRKEKRENVESINEGGSEEFGTHQNNEDGDSVSVKRNVLSGLREKKLQKSRKKKRENVESINEGGSEEFGTQQNSGDGDRVSDRGNVESAMREKKLQKSRKKKRENAESINEGGIEEFGTQQNNEDGDRVSVKRNVLSAMKEKKLQKSRKKKRKSVESINEGDGVSQTADASEQHNDSNGEDHIAKDGRPNKADTSRNTKTGKLKKRRKKYKESQLQINELNPDNLLEKREQDAEDDVVYQMSSGDEDHSKGMKKWITQYHQSRPGLKLLQERIDDFIMAHEAQQEQARIEREAKAAEGGWTVVVHHKGRKKTTDAESGVAVGSVARAAVLDKMEKKKKKEVGLDFYSFQKKEARRNELRMLQSKFEEDKKRIQQMRAARKFRPY